ncbi:zinc-finger domain-containing protein [Bacillus massiliigorillae]|uniref:zinc-finger domain-containing protein n=1 Tax=Bacillus massiliigorillae TaxID=1243664 RepID=UPI0009DE0A2A|nr:zinc-finger domain-containing protein [Bacillus massiliigorillae]
MNRKQERKIVLQQIEETLTLYCNGCFLYNHHKKDYGRTYAHKYCLSSCTVGERLKDFGQKLNICDR